jgi:two-component system nitrogen regulation response regulator NtrX
VATHRNLEELVQKGTFRQDLYHRVFVFPIYLPPLRDRREDIPVLVEHFSAGIAQTNTWKAKPFTAQAVEALVRHSWPGNIRELRNAVERLLLLAEDQVDEALVQTVLPRASQAAVKTGTLAARVDDFERETIRMELERARNNMTEAARTLGLERSHLYKKCAQLGINVRELRRVEE